RTGDKRLAWRAGAFRSQSRPPCESQPRNQAKGPDTRIGEAAHPLQVGPVAKSGGAVILGLAPATGKRGRKRWQRNVRQRQDPSAFRARGYGPALSWAPRAAAPAFPRRGQRGGDGLRVARTGAVPRPAPTGFETAGQATARHIRLLRRGSRGAA